MEANGLLNWNGPATFSGGGVQYVWTSSFYGLQYSASRWGLRCDGTNYPIAWNNGGNTPIAWHQLYNPAGGPTNWALVMSDGSTNFFCFCDTASDRRIKKDIADTTVDALAVINAIPVRQYSIRGEYLTATQATARDGVPIEPTPQSDHPVEIGLVTQEVASLIPDMVGVSPGQPDQSSNPDIPADLQHIVLDRAVPHLIRAIQQLTARVAELEARP